MWGWGEGSLDQKGRCLDFIELSLVHVFSYLFGAPILLLQGVGYTEEGLEKVKGVLVQMMLFFQISSWLPKGLPLGAPVWFTGSTPPGATALCRFLPQMVPPASLSVLSWHLSAEGTTHRPLAGVLSTPQPSQAVRDRGLPGSPLPGPSVRVHQPASCLQTCLGKSQAPSPYAPNVAGDTSPAHAAREEPRLSRLGF